ncbi:MAG: hypothetical protein V3V08_01340 [Nannocystaceae bacterium]
MSEELWLGDLPFELQRILVVTSRPFNQFIDPLHLKFRSNDCSTAENISLPPFIR